jgi:hypothetical protein
MLLATNISAQDLSQYGWKKGVKINGGLNFNTVNYASNGIGNRRDPFNWFASGNFNINLFGYSLPFSFALSNAARNYTQPFNRVQFKPSYKWIKAYWGNTSMSFSPLTLSGHLFNGYGIELSKGKWNFAAMTGKLKEAVAYDAIAKNASTTSFKRKGWGFKAGYRFKSGDELNVIFFTAKDDINSLTFVPLEAQLVPKQNFVASIGGKKKLFKKFNVQLEYALSSIITDKTAIDNGTSARAKNFLNLLLPNKPNAKFYDAIKGSFGYNAKKYGIQLQYERITPEYQTLGAYFFNTDMENYTIAPTLNLLRGKINIGGSIGIQKNNLDKTKNSTTKRFVGNMNMGFNPNEKWSYTAAYSNFTTFTNIRPQNDPFFQNQLDTLNFYQVNNSINANASHQFGNKEVPKSISLSTSYQKASDQQPGTQAGVQVSDFITSNIAYTQTFAKRGISISSSINYSLNNAPKSKVVFIGPNVNVSAPLFKKLIRTSMGASYNKNISNGVSNSAVISARASFSYAPKAKTANSVQPKNKIADTTANHTSTVKEAAKVNKKKGFNFLSLKKTNKTNTPLVGGGAKIIQVQNPLKGKQSLSLNINYMNRLPALNVPKPFSELTVTFNWSYTF